MSEMDPVRVRTLMGAALNAAVDLPGMVGQVTDEAWTFLTGLPSADVNLALVQSPDPRVLADSLDTIATAGQPTILMLAGDGRAQSAQLPDTWTAAGAMPIMSVDLIPTSGQPDPRLRVAMPGQDDETVSRLNVEAFGIEASVIGPFMAAALAADPAVVRVWLVEDAGVAVSSVVSILTDDVVSLWSMATPPQFARRGYGRALLGGVLAWAGQAGARVGLLGATPAGEPLYASTGWKALESWDLFVNAVSAQFSPA